MILAKNDCSTARQAFQGNRRDAVVDDLVQLSERHVEDEAVMHYLRLINGLARGQLAAIIMEQSAQLVMNAFQNGHCE
ncbi:hypothetical protein Q5H91_04675 [Sphingomonas sp. KR1UV-12]|uniref:Uncharacterized protein n=1 Tax=Sphingomonas aurea TaxID=3063994 RepID=A0ABT9EI35_9SPHN|nr:hypothetical protein [Sphingomonas sp. KR1UV-12]MDP1026497.1 hypothetical protein [Sphingomonas sp. KR1UV-12]